MSLFLSSAVLSLLAGLVVWLTGRRDPAGSPLLTFGSLLALLALPFLGLLPKWTIELPLVAAANGLEGANHFSWLALAWAGGCFFFALRLAVDFVSLARWRRQAQPADDPRLAPVIRDCTRALGLTHDTPVKIHPEAASPSIAGLFHPVIYLPANSRAWSDDTLRMVLLHELGHVARRDLWTNLAAHGACLVHWFNPLVWWLRGRLMAQCEFACDAKVIEVGADPTHYASALCDVAEAGAVPQAALAMAGRASLRQRVERVVRRPGSHRSLLAGVALALTVTTSLALSLVRVAGLDPSSSSLEPTLQPVYTPEEIKIRLTANPFPAD